MSTTELVDVIGTEPSSVPGWICTPPGRRRRWFITTKAPPPSSATASPAKTAGMGDEPEPPPLVRWSAPTEGCARMVNVCGGLIDWTVTLVKLGLPWSAEWNEFTSSCASWLATWLAICGDEAVMKEVMISEPVVHSRRTSVSVMLPPTLMTMAAL